MTLTFDPESHTYHSDGVKLDGVTTVIGKQFIIKRNEEVVIVPHRPDEYMVRIPMDEWVRAGLFGTAVHKMAEYYDHGILNESTLDPNLVPYLNGYKKFLTETKFEVEAIEEQVFSEKYGFAGTLDRRGMLRWVPNPRPSRTIIDIKSGSGMQVSAALQTAAYQGAYNEGRKTERVTQRATLLLMPDDYKLKKWADPGDWPAFLATLTIYRWRTKNHGN